MIVSNTTPISNLLHLNRIEILQHLFKKIHIPPAVKQELEVTFSAHSKWRQCLKNEFFIIRNIKNPLLIRQLRLQLHPGEAEALCVCMENKADLCLLDDKDARVIAGLNKIPVTGTLGILIQAKNKGMLDSVKYSMDELKNCHHFWISNAMYKKVLELSGEKSMDSS